MTPKPQDFCAFGVTNHAGGNFRYIQLDYDFDTETRLKLELKPIVKRYSHAIVLKTTHGFHVYVCRVVHKRKWLKTVLRSKCDEQFKVKAQKKHYTTLRLSPKYYLEYDESGKWIKRLKKVADAPKFYRIYAEGVPRVNVHLLRMLRCFFDIPTFALKPEWRTVKTNFVYYYTAKGGRNDGEEERQVRKGVGQVYE